jgi:hypothetical protein
MTDQGAADQNAWGSFITQKFGEFIKHGFKAGVVKPKVAEVSLLILSYL